MKLAFFDDFKLGVVKGDTIYDVTAVVRDIPHVGPGDLISGLIARFDNYRAAAGRRDHRRRHARSNVRIRPPLPRPATSSAWR